LSEYFFFQAEDGIRDYKVTGVQTCALPIYFKQNTKQKQEQEQEQKQQQMQEKKLRESKAQAMKKMIKES